MIFLSVNNSGGETPPSNEASFTKLPNTSKYKPLYSQIDRGSYTSSDGTLVRKMIRAEHIAIDVEWARLTAKEFKDISTLIMKKESFWLRYYDLASNTYKVGKFYAFYSAPEVRTLANGVNSFSFACKFTEY